MDFTYFSEFSKGEMSCCSLPRDGFSSYQKWGIIFHYHIWFQNVSNSCAIVSGLTYECIHALVCRPTILRITFGTSGNTRTLFWLNLKHARGNSLIKRIFPESQYRQYLSIWNMHFTLYVFLLYSLKGPAVFWFMRYSYFPSRFYFVSTLQTRPV